MGKPEVRKEKTFLFALALALMFVACVVFFLQMEDQKRTVHKLEKESVKQKARADKHEAAIVKHVAPLKDKYPAFFPNPIKTLDKSLEETTRIMQDQNDAILKQEWEIGDLQMENSRLKRKALRDRILWAERVEQLLDQILLAELPEACPWRDQSETLFTHLSVVRKGWGVKRLLEHVGFPERVGGVPFRGTSKKELIKACMYRLPDPGFVDFAFKLDTFINGGWYAKAMRFRLDLSDGTVSRIKVDYGR
ncbi:MAG: hypothetical protein ACYS47_04480 [Planctomycetota bacterium]|jgi:hypothetical protein